MIHLLLYYMSRHVRATSTDQISASSLTSLADVVLVLLPAFNVHSSLETAERHLASVL